MEEQNNTQPDSTAGDTVQPETSDSTTTEAQPAAEQVTLTQEEYNKRISDAEAKGKSIAERQQKRSEEGVLDNTETPKTALETVEQQQADLSPDEVSAVKSVAQREIASQRINKELADVNQKIDDYYIANKNTGVTLPNVSDVKKQAAEGNWRFMSVQDIVDKVGMSKPEDDDTASEPQTRSNVNLGAPQQRSGDVNVDNFDPTTMTPEQQNKALDNMNEDQLRQVVKKSQRL